MTVLLLLGCHDSPGPNPKDAGSEAEREASAGKKRISDAEARLNRITSGETDWVNPFAGDLTPVRRGEYLVRHVSGCMECHTPRGVALKFDETRLLSGVEGLVDTEPEYEGIGLIHSKNLTPDPDTGLGDWSDEEIKDAFQNGLSRDGTFLNPVMPYHVFHLMKDDDADAVVEYLRSIPSVRHEVPPNEPPLFQRTGPAPPFPIEALPESMLEPGDPDYENAQRGKYLATALSPCLYCHTETTPRGDGPAIDWNKPFMGRRKWKPVSLGSTALEGVDFIETKNLTPTKDGLADWTATEVGDAIRFGRDRAGRDLCPPMPYGPEGSFGLMLESDAEDIGAYLTSIPARDNGEFERCCKACHSSGDAGARLPPSMSCASLGM